MIERLARLVRKPERRIVGLMSGTSMDGIDAALVRVRGAGLGCNVELVQFRCVPYEAGLRARLARAAAGEPLPSAEHARLHFEVAACFAQAAHAVIAGAGLTAADVDLIGTHGQTLFHHAAGSGTWQPGEASWQAGSLPALAAFSGIITVGDFRAADIALGGTGAPLVPYVDFLLRRSPTESRILLNVGGIANLTYLRAAGDADAVLAWDVGPGNMVLDGLAHALLGLDCDRGGSHAAGGHADAVWIEELLAEEYFTRAAPKSAGREQFGASYTHRLLGQAGARGLGSEDLLATAVELTARAVSLARAQAPLTGLPVDAVYVSGGGRHNATLMRRLAQLWAPVPVRGLDALGVDPDAKEAVDFAVLANETLHGLAGNLVRVTGARRRCILGAIAVAGEPPGRLDAPGATS
jgi:anhydro-N-acetylmuramic acid kinase